jgi:hypothetical protein
MRLGGIRVPLVVTGISQTADTGAVEQALRGAGLSLEPLSVYLTGEAPEGRPDSGARFIYGDTDSIRDMLGGSSGIFSSGGGRVPGLQSGAAPEHYFRPETLGDQLSELDIPDSEVENYLAAMDAGHAVVAYFARPETVGPVEGLFRSSGLANVRVF